jgi:prepilin-type N-terminal cleavage/methylation domain-containing protein
MNRSPFLTRSSDNPQRSSKALKGFTLIELLVVIAIIAILAGLTVPAVLAAMRRAKVASVVVEMSQLDAALKAYKEKFGEYPPDFTDTTWPGPISRHLAKAFPRCTIDKSTFETAIKNATNLDYADLTPATALVFWLGGMKDTDGNLIGFSANPTDPFNRTSTSRIGPFYDFDRAHLSGYRYWPKEVRAATTGSIVYFRAENGGYYCPGDDTKAKYCVDPTDGGRYAIAAQDSAFSKYDASATPKWKPVWVNPKGFQIIFSGMGLRYSVYDISAVTGALNYPSGEDGVGGFGYLPETYDDITNFSGGTLEDKKP